MQQILKNHVLMYRKCFLVSLETEKNVSQKDLL